MPSFPADAEQTSENVAVTLIQRGRTTMTRKILGWLAVGMFVVTAAGLENTALAKKKSRRYQGGGCYQPCGGGAPPQCEAPPAQCCAPPPVQCCAPPPVECCAPQPTCCQPPPTCCAPPPTCCQPAPTCCAPVTPCAGGAGGYDDGGRGGIKPAPKVPDDDPPEPKKA